MGLFDKLFSRNPAPCAMEAYVAELLPSMMNRKIATVAKSMKVPMAVDPNDE